MRMLFEPKTWGITTRLVLVATVPALLMFLVVTLALYIAGQDESASAVQEHGTLIALALAETSQYGVISGNTEALERSIHQLMRVDPGIAAVEIQDKARKTLVSVRQSWQGEDVLFERAIKSEVPAIDLFDRTSAPHASLNPGLQTQFRPGLTSGYVRVLMSPAPILSEKRRRLYSSAAAVLLAMAISTAIGLYLAQRLRAPLRVVMAALRGIRQGRFEVRLSTRAGGELGELQAAIVEMAKGLSVTHQEREAEVANRTYDLQQAVEQAAEADAEKRRLIVRGNAQVEEERKRIAMEIHDHMNAELIVLRMKAQQLADRAAQDANDLTSQDIERIANEIADTTGGLYATARNIVKQLRPEVIDTLGLQAAIEEMVSKYDSLHPDCQFSLNVGESFPALRGQLAITAFRLVQEALTNVVKHSGATLVTVTLDMDKMSPCVVIIVADNGRGFNPKVRPAGSIGLVGMRERVSAVVGSMTIDTSPYKGSAITFALPLHASQS